MRERTFNIEILRMCLSLTENFKLRNRKKSPCLKTIRQNRTTNKFIYNKLTYIDVSVAI